MAIKSDFSGVMPEAPEHAHFIGIGGAGMSGIALLFLAAGIRVSGSDIRDTATTDELEAAGATITIGHRASALGSADVVIVTGAISEDNPEYALARERQLPILHRALALAWLTSSSRLVAVAGAHGKTTSTGMLIEALLALGERPSFVNGGVIRSLGTSSGSGDGELFVVEADESDGSFLLYDTAVALITNVDPDHLDHFGSAEAFENAFVSFAGRAREFVAISSDDPGAVAMTPRLSGTVVTFGEAPTADVRIHSVVTADVVSFSIAYQGEDYPVVLQVPGHHNALNAAGAFAVLAGIGVAPRAAVDAIATFGGTERRFEPHGEIGGVRLFDDFAHHPTEIRAALSAARGVAGAGRVIPIFQPHLYSRTRMLAQDFADVFDELADYTIVVPVYGARQDPEPGITGATITERFRSAGRGEYVEEWADAARLAASIARPGDFIVTMGGGDIYRIVPETLSALRDRSGAEPIASPADSPHTPAGPPAGR